MRLQVVGGQVIIGTDTTSFRPGNDRAFCFLLTQDKRLQPSLFPSSGANPTKLCKGLSTKHLTDPSKLDHLSQIDQVAVGTGFKFIDVGKRITE